MSDTTHSLFLETEAETAAFGARLADMLETGDVVLLFGEIGAGKSFLSRAMIRHLCGQETEVPSPTFTLVQTYETDDFDLWHADLYRLSDPDEAEELGLTEAFETGVCLIEWPERLGPYLPEGALKVYLAAAENGHEARLVFGAPWAEKMERMGLGA